MVGAIDELAAMVMGKAAVLQAQASSPSTQIWSWSVVMQLGSVETARCFGVVMLPCSALRCDPGMGYKKAHWQQNTCPTLVQPSSTELPS